MSILIQNGHVINPATNTSEVMDVLIKGKKIKAMGKGLSRDDVEQVIDATGLVVTPGLVDIHVHFREPGQTSKEDIVSGARAGAAGGFTTVVTMANTMPRVDNASAVLRALRRSKEDACINVLPTACATKEMKGEEITPMAELKDAGIVAVTDDGQDICSSAIMRRVFEYAAMLDLPYMAHCEDESLAAGGAMNEGYTATRLGIPGIPKAAEEIRIDRNIRLAEMTGAHVHIQHVTTAEGIDTVRHFKSKGYGVTCEVCPHHWMLTDEAIAEFDTNAKMNPPLREQSDIDGIIAGIKDGTVDCISTDHAPHTPTEKEVEFSNAPFGIIGLETALPLVIKGLVEPGHITLERAIELMTWAPSKMMHLSSGILAEGGKADLCIFDAKQKWTVTLDDIYSKSRNTPFLGEEVTGRVRYTLCDGKVVHEG